MKSISTFIFMLIVFAISAQSTNSITYTQLNSPTCEKGYYQMYFSKDSSVYQIGDTLQLGIPSGTTFLYIRQGAELNAANVPNSYANTRCVVKKVMVFGNKRMGYKVQLQTTGSTFLDNYFIDLEAALKTGEIKKYNPSN